MVLKFHFTQVYKGHSDGDPIIHATIDSILGALRKKDIEKLYILVANKKYKNIRSPKMLKPCNLEQIKIKKLLY